MVHSLDSQLESSCEVGQFVLDEQAAIEVLDEALAQALLVLNLQFTLILVQVTLAHASLRCHKTSSEASFAAFHSGGVVTVGVCENRPGLGLEVRHIIRTPKK